jgi:membrane-associated HD superfamily phosphohydrolase
MSIMFLPDYLMAQFSGISISSKSESRMMVSQTTTLLDFTDKKQKSTNWFSPLVTFWLLFVVVTLLSAAEAYGTINLKFADVIIFSISGLVGILIFYLSWISNHQVTSPNWNFLWANPLWLVLVTNVTPKIKGFIRFLETISITIFLFITFTCLQFIPNEVFPIILILLVRSIRPFRWWLSGRNSLSAQ